MPLTVNIGISRKASANYQSAGLSINLTAELDQSLLADPPRLQSEIDRIYRAAAARPPAPRPASTRSWLHGRGRTLRAWTPATSQRRYHSPSSSKRPTAAGSPPATSPRATPSARCPRRASRVRPRSPRSAAATRSSPSTTSPSRARAATSWARAGWWCTTRAIHQSSTSVGRRISTSRGARESGAPTGSE